MHNVIVFKVQVKKSSLIKAWICVDWLQPRSAFVCLTFQGGVYSSLITKHMPDMQNKKTKLNSDLLGKCEDYDFVFGHSFAIFPRRYQQGLLWSSWSHPRVHFQHLAAGGACVQEAESALGRKSQIMCLSFLAGPGYQYFNFSPWTLRTSGCRLLYRDPCFLTRKVGGNILGTCRKRSLLNLREEKNLRKEPGLAPGFCWKRRTQKAGTTAILCPSITGLLPFIPWEDLKGWEWYTCRKALPAPIVQGAGLGLRHL